MLRLAVEDDGPGLPHAERGRVFERGRKLDEATPGSGLGLSIVRDLLEAYAGSIRLEDSPLGGLRVVVLLPLAQASAAGRQARNARMAAGQIASGGRLAAGNAGQPGACSARASHT